MSAKEIQCKGIDWVCLAQERVKWQAVLHTVMNLQQSDGEFLDEFTKYDLFQGLIHIQVAKDSCSVYCVYFHFFPMFLFFMFYFVFFNLLRCVLFLTEPHAYVNLSYILLKKKQCCYWFHSTLILVEVSV
jgi:hypothetical protein